MGPVSYLKRSLFKLELISLGIFWPKLAFCAHFSIWQFSYGRSHRACFLGPVSYLEKCHRSSLREIMAKELIISFSLWILLFYQFKMLVPLHIMQRSIEYWCAMQKYLSNNYLEEALRKHLAFSGNCSPVCMLRNSYVRTKILSSCVKISIWHFIMIALGKSERCQSTTMKEVSVKKYSNHY